MTENKDLLPCPFCGNKRCVYGETGRVGYYYIDCSQCHTTLNGYDLEDLIKRWNTRAESPKLGIAVKALEFYADKNTYKVNVIECVKYHKLIDNDIGQTAKSALQQIKESRNEVI